MACSHAFDLQKRMLVLTREGEVSGKEISDSFRQAVAADDFRSIDKILIDHSGSDFSRLSSESVVAIGQLYREILQGSRIRIAVVAPASENYGVSRMFEQYSGLDDVRVFRSGEEALAWLG